jgi:hypothetical protein
MPVDHGQLIDVWESGAGRSVTERGLLLLALCAPMHELAALVRWSVGARDAALLSLRERLFGTKLSCLSDCSRCGERLELSFGVADVCSTSAEVGELYELEAFGHCLSFRLPNSEDLLCAETAASVDAAARLLLERCVTGVAHDGRSVSADALPSEVVGAITARMRALDEQADVTVDVSCPGCECAEAKSFDIVTHLWTELDAWACRALHEVHALARGYGWSEREILSLSASRRRAYLELLGATS